MIGIYRISSQSRIYIGSSKDIEQRWREHRYDLAQGKHHSRYMQRMYNKYGLESFTFEVIELVDTVEDLLRREQYHLDCLFELMPRKSILNSSPTAGSALGVKHSDETRMKMRESNKGKGISRRGKPLSEEHRKKLSDARKGKSPANKGKPLSAEHKKLLSDIKLGIKQPDYDGAHKYRYMNGKK